MALRLTPIKRLLIVIFISCTFCVLELAIGFRTSSLAMIADGFHVSNDLIGFIIALVALVKVRQSERDKASGDLFSWGRYTFGWERAEILGAFFNGVFLLALSVSILLQTIERLLDPKPVEKPMYIIIVGSIGLTFNIISAFTHNHASDSSSSAIKDLKHPEYSSAGRRTQASHESASRNQKRQERDLNTLGVFIHLLGDAFNNFLVIISAVVYMKTGFIYCDCIASACVGIMIMSTALPLVKQSGIILLESAPPDIDICLVVKDLQQAHNVERVTGIHVWQLTQTKVLATVQITLLEPSLSNFHVTCSQICYCLDSWGIHQVCIQPQYQPTSKRNSPIQLDSKSIISTRSISKEIPVIMTHRRPLSFSQYDLGEFRSSPYHLPPIRPSRSDEGHDNLTQSIQELAFRGFVEN
ncbi:hypothetical protein CROQUDRAFT_46776 [Cronartium quercuum f. sp. fusiforme G11]|uniref:Cation efflux protein transmembrane domain-containing protein n=1 Tax=Cronartium quercuum f. sp. fusiforme G11 TaxID=708437 RepID=A0A9P6TA53_9BASI|nr:hypothetical protein CROQUDRAFT_46776 [Cronartium quercuum f. sp. fusiforme G11]